MNDHIDLQKEKGAVAVIVAILLVVVISMAAVVIDLGALYERRRQVQTAVDGAALAGAQELPDQSNAAAKARQYLILDGIPDASSAQIVFPSSMTVKVTAPPQTVVFSLAPIMGSNSSTVAATATAIKEYRIQTAPWALVLGSLTPAQLAGTATVSLKVGSGSSNQGNFQSITIPRTDVTGADKTYQRNIELGSQQALAVGQVYDTLTGNKVGPLTSGLTDTDPPGLLTQGTDAARIAYSPPGNSSVMIDACTTSCVFGTTSSPIRILEPGCPRIVRVPVIQAWPNGHAPVQVTSLTWLFISQPPPPTSGQISELYGYILNLSESTWPYTIRLIE